MPAGGRRPHRGSCCTATTSPTTSSSSPWRARRRARRRRRRWTSSTGSTRSRGAAGVVQPVLLRVIPERRGRHPSSRSPPATTRRSSACRSAAAPRTSSRRRRSLAGVRFDGLHAHVGSQVLDREPYLRALDVLVDARGAAPRRRTASTAADPRHGRRVRRHVHRRATRWPSRARRRGAERRLPGACARPGSRRCRRSSSSPAARIVGNAGRHAVPGRRSARTLGGRADAARGRRRDVRQHPADALRRAVHGGAVASGAGGRPRGPFTVVGRHCESGDVLAERRARCPPTSGAATCWRSPRPARTRTRWRARYNRVGRPAVVGVRDGRRDACGSGARMPPTSTAWRPPRHGRPPTPSRPTGITIRAGRARGRRVPSSTFWTAIVARAATCAARRSSHSGARLPRAVPPPVDRSRGAGRGARRRARVVGPRLHPARGAPRHPPRRDARDRGGGRPSRPRHRQRADGRGVPLGPRRRRGEDRALGLPAQHGRDRALPAVRLRARRDGSSRHSRKSYGDEDEILMAAWIADEDSRERTGMSERTMRVGMLGCGTVGAAVIRLLHEHARRHRAARRLPPRGHARRRARPSIATATCRLPARRSPPTAASVVDDPDVDIVCELIGGLEPARELILRAFAHGKPVVTGQQGAAGERTAGSCSTRPTPPGVDLFFEAAVAGGIPLIRPLKESLAGERVSRMLGIVNGTTNYILTQMSEHGSVVRPTRWPRPSGWATRRPIPPPTSRASTRPPSARSSRRSRSTPGWSPSDVYREGITGVTAAGHRRRRAHGLRREAARDRRARGRRDHRPGPPGDDPRRASARLASATRSTRCSSRATKVGQLMFYGRGAGGDPTAAAVVGDLVDGGAQPRHGRPRRSAAPARSSAASGRWTTRAASTT